MRNSRPQAARLKQIELRNEVNGMADSVQVLESNSDQFDFREELATVLGVRERGMLRR
jgi:hypothetical protein